MELDSQTLAVLTGVLIPILVGIVTKLDASSGLKAVLNAFLSAVAGALSTVVANSGQLVWREFVTGVAITWVVSVATYYGLYKPSGVAGTVAATTAGFGIGSPPTLETDEKGMEDVMVAGTTLAPPVAPEQVPPAVKRAAPVKKAAAKKAAPKKDS